MRTGRRTVRVQMWAVSVGACVHVRFFRLVTVLTQPSLQVDGEEDIGKGLSLYEMAEVLLQLGCWQAVVGDLPSRSYDQ